MPEAGRSPPLDLLLYAHDGRGLGHVSRSVAVGLAVRRLHPGLRTLLVSGARGCAELIGPAPLDWVKLPAYATQVVDGRSRGIDGPSGFADAALGALRAELIERLIATLRPRLVLADHAPQGKHRELLGALERNQGEWLLGVRAVLGDVPQLRSAIARSAFSAHYAGALWYGDGAVLGAEEPGRLQELLGLRPSEVGYVSRLAELEAGGWLSRGAPLAGTVAVPWAGDGVERLAVAMAGALRSLGPGLGPWRVFVDGGDGGALDTVREAFAALDHCRVEPAGAGYAEALLASRVAVVFGGYNSLTDVLHAGIPALVLLRGMADREQERHVERLVAGGGAPFAALAEEEASPGALAAALESLLGRQPAAATVRLDGAERAAHAIARRLREL